MLASNPGAEINPYRPPAADVLRRPAEDDAERTRRELLKHETSVRSIGALYYISFGVLLLGTLGLTAVIATGETEPFLIGLTVFYGLLAALSYYLARGLRRLDPKVRGPVSLLSGIGLLAFPLGTLVNGYILYLLHSAKGKRVMTDSYREIVRRTPYIKYRTPVWLIIVALAFAVLLVVLMVMAFSG